MVKENVYALLISVMKLPFENRILTVRFDVSMNDVAGMEIGKAV